MECPICHRLLNEKLYQLHLAAHRMLARRRRMLAGAAEYSVTAEAGEQEKAKDAHGR